MSLFSSIRRLMYRAREAWGLASYLQSRQFAVRIESKIHNTSTSPVIAFIVVPIPGNTATQQLHDEPTIEPKPDVLAQDPVYGNRYAAWELELRPNSVIDVREYFIIRLKPFRAALSRSFLDEYARLPRKLIDPYLEPTPLTNQTDERIREIAARVKGNQTDPTAIAKAINRYVVRALAYGDPILGLYSASDALERNRVDCGGFSALFVALAKAVGIPARIVTGCWTRKHDAMHAWAEWMHPSGTWVPLDASIESLARQGRTKKSGRFAFIGSDRIALSHGDSILIPHAGGLLRADILQHPAVFVGSEPGERYGVHAESVFYTPKIWRD